MLTPPRVRLVDVAAAAKVSKQTVSRVVNGSADVSEHTRTHVLEVIARLGYRPSVSARTLCHGRSYTLAVVGSDSGFLATELYQGAARQAAAMGYSLLLKPLANPCPEAVEELFWNLVDTNIDGVLWAIPDVRGRNDWIRGGLLARIPLPVVFLSTEPYAGLTTVSFDNFDGAHLATQHLIDTGRQCIGHISGPLGWWVARERVRGWQATLAEAGFDAPATHLAEGNWAPESGQHAMAELLAHAPELDAVFVSNDRMALGALLTIHRRGLRVPNDIAIIGFDNLIESACFYPPLTTILQDKRKHGELGVATLIGQVSTRFDTPNQAQIALPALSHTLIVRESTR